MGTRTRALKRRPLATGGLARRKWVARTLRSALIVGGIRGSEHSPATAAAAPAGVTGVTGVTGVAGGFAPTEIEAGHRLRDRSMASVEGTTTQRCPVLIVGAGIAGLAAARALMKRGVDEYRVIELAAVAGGNSRGSSVGGLPCPAGAHYLPLPGPQAPEIADFLTEIGVRDSRGRYSERALVHSPQERLFIHGVWQDGLLPIVAQDARTFAQYRRFAEAIDTWRASNGFAVPVARALPDEQVTALGRDVFARWLDQERYDAPGLRWYLDYCCRDEYGAGSETVSAWAGLHYFASRHGFSLPPTVAGDRSVADDRDTMLTWPQGNGWLVERLAAPIGDRLAHGMGIRHLRRDRSTGRWIATVLANDSERMQILEAERVIWAAPLFIAARVIDDPSGRAAPLARVLESTVRAPWVVANLLVDARWRPVGGELAWDNVIYDSPALGYVDARHQRLDRLGGDRLLTWYRALGTDPGGREALARTSFSTMAAEVTHDLARAHPEIGRHLRRIDIHRWGHAMAVPTPGAFSPFVRDAREALGHGRDGLWFAHSDLSGYSVFEEAFCRGHAAGLAVAAHAGGNGGTASSVSGAIERIR